MQQLYDWKEKTTRKPLIVRGARQVGKTWLMKEFASSAYRQFAYINFEDNEVMKDVFQKDFDVERILMAIQLVTGIVVDTETLIIFDEIQEVTDWEKCINSLRVSLDCDIYITGSNAKLLSGELATYLGGRYVEFVIYPPSGGSFHRAPPSTDAG